jgi:hypothetical protein
MKTCFANLAAWIPCLKLEPSLLRRVASLQVRA